MAILITGAAGFIGFSLAKTLLEMGHSVIGMDCYTPYYDVRLKHARVKLLQEFEDFEMIEANFGIPDAILPLSERLEHVTAIVHLGAQAGVRYSLKDPFSYITSNVMGQTVMCELARTLPQCTHMVYASTSSAYGKAAGSPMSLSERCETPRSLYAASKRACEHIAYSYADMHGLKSIGMRFFTVYGPWGRPDMAMWQFTDAILAGKPIQIYNHGDMQRDFTYIDDIVAGLIVAIGYTPSPDAYGVPHRVFNLGNSHPTPLMDMVALLERELGKTAIKEFLPMQLGDVQATSADISESRAILGFEPKTLIEEGLPRFVAWYKDYHGV